MSTDASDLVTRLKPPIARYKRPMMPQFVPDPWTWIVDAIEDVGKQMYGGEWSGNEWRARELGSLTGVDVLDEAKLVDAGWTIASDIGLHRTAPPELTRFAPPPSFTIQPATKDEYETERAAAIRYARAGHWLRSRWWSGDLRVSRLDDKMRPIKPGRWSDGNFFFCAIRYGTSNRSDERGHLVIRKSDLALALGANRPSAPRPSPAVAAAPIKPRTDQLKPAAGIGSADADNLVSDQELREWLRLYFDEHKGDAKHPQEPEIERAAKDHFSPRKLRKLRPTLRSATRPPEWNQRGRTRGS